MNQPARIEFTVDEQYENEKGVFTVISIHRDQMVIRWKNGEEIRTDVELQRRIIERRHWEELNQAAESTPAVKAAEKSASTAKSRAFTGFSNKDFKNSASGTTWRSRTQIGKAVIEKIDSAQFKFNSWAFGNKPEMHLQDTKHRASGANDYQARFFVRLDQKSLEYGFRVGRTNPDGDAAPDGEAFHHWLTQEANEQMIQSLALENNLTVCHRSNSATLALTPSQKGWQAIEKGSQPEQETLAGQISSMAQTRPVDFELFATTEKSDAIAKGAGIAADIAGLVTKLLPLYHAAVIH